MSTAAARLHDAPRSRVPSEETATSSNAAPRLFLKVEGSGEHFEFLQSARSPERRFRFRWTLAPGKRGPPPHMHLHETESFTLVAGRLSVWVGGELHELAPGDSVTVPPRVPHRFLNSGTEPAVVDVSLDAHFQEDTFIPYAVLQTSGEHVSIWAFVKNTIVQFATGTVGAHPALLQLFMRNLARVLVGLGVRNLSPIEGWDVPGVSLESLRARVR